MDYCGLFLVQDKEMLHGPVEYGVDDGKFTEYYRAYVCGWLIFE